MSTAYIPPWEEHLFWLEILQDHAYFVRDHLSPEEVQWVQMADEYVNAFGNVLHQLRQLDPQLPPSSPEMMEFSQISLEVSQGYYQFESYMQHLRLQNKVNLNLTPTYLNGTLSENREYLRILHYYTQGQEYPPMPFVDLLDLWLEDQVGHAVLLRNIMDPIEIEVTSQADQFISLFRGFILQNFHLKGFLQVMPHGLPRQDRLARDVGRASIDMNLFIVDVVQRYKDTEVLNRTTLRFLEHHFPESCYFIKKLSAYAPELANEAMYCSLQKPSFPNLNEM
ncbi:DUF2935 domain-containing protein [Alkalihalobacterium bogoriense]|uniref:DUF2935 domain-containing protein n=1 Tax=Alkalihalobacterium bogoriense TaxID=246272 RepID=UPI00047C0C9A|nr:DUF2935 domain-containing protein [Alkalihalobacterium bogoriense]